MDRMATPRISEDMSSEPPSARWLVRELVLRARLASRTPDNLAAVAFEACDTTYRGLARDLGTASAQALVIRARAQVGMKHPALLEVAMFQPRTSGGPASPMAWNSDCRATAEAFEALLEALLALLGRFVGINIVVRLLDPAGAHDVTPNEGAR